MERSSEQTRARGVEAISLDKIAVRLIGIRYPWWRLVVGACVVVLAGIFASTQGSVDIPFMAVVEILVSRLPGIAPASELPSTWDTILWQLRIPRVVLAAIVGGALAMSGAAYQGLFKNPLADPYLVGVASGAGLAATIVLLTGIPMVVFGISVLPIAAFAGGIGAVAAAYSIARSSQGTPLTTLILAGVAISSLAGAVSSLLMIRSDPGSQTGPELAARQFYIGGVERKRDSAAVPDSQPGSYPGIRADTERASIRRRTRRRARGQRGEGEADPHRHGYAGHGHGGLIQRSHRFCRTGPRLT